MAYIIKKEQADILDKIRNWAFKTHNDASDLLKQYEEAFKKEIDNELAFPRVDDLNDNYLELLHNLGELYKEVEDVREEIYKNNAQDSKLMKKFHIFSPESDYTIMDIEGKYRKWNEIVQNKYESLWPDASYHIWDGVISPSDYANAAVKIMFLNKEAYDEDSYDISTALKEQIIKKEPIFCNYSIRWNTKNRLSVLSKLDKDLSSLNDDDFISYSEDNFYSDMLKVAYCNIKKSNGVGKSNINNLKDCFIRNKDIIEEQILFLNPTVIVGGNIVDGIMDNNIEWGEDLYKSESRYINVYQVKVRGILYPFLDMYHPAKSISHQIDRTELLKALVAVDAKIPGFWVNRCGKSCFDMKK